MPPRRLLPAALAFLLLLTSAFAEILTLTDQQGRTLTADVLSVEGDKAKIKRTDGMTFELSLSTLAEADQTKLREWAAREADKPLPADAIEVVAGRANFGSKKTETVEPYTILYTNGTSERSTRTRVSIDEQWGYSVTLGNRTPKSIDKLRAEYILFTGSAQNLTRGAVFSLPVGVLKSREKTAQKTTTVTLTKTYYKGESSPKPVGSQLYGIWIRVYRGETLVHEYSSPDSLRVSQTW